MMHRVLGILLFVMISKQFVQSEFHAWCNLEQFGCGNFLNSMCLYDENPYKHQCLNMVDGVKEKAWILKYWLALINSFRDQVAGGNFGMWPKASNMKQLVWDNMLEAQARRWNFQCILARADDCNRNMNFKKSQIGQLQLSIRGVTEETFMSQMKALFLSAVEEGTKIVDVNGLIDKGMSQELIQSGEPGSLLFPVLVADSEYVGASLIVSGWESLNESNIMRANTYTAPISYGSPIYERGASCSNCPKGWFCNSKGSYPNLCAQSSYPKFDQNVDISFALRRVQSSYTKSALIAAITFLSESLRISS